MLAQYAVGDRVQVNSFHVAGVEVEFAMPFVAGITGMQYAQGMWLYFLEGTGQVLNGDEHRIWGNIPETALSVIDAPLA